MPPLSSAAWRGLALFAVLVWIAFSLLSMRSTPHYPRGATVFESYAAPNNWTKIFKRDAGKGFAADDHFIRGLGSLAPALPQNVTNGDSLWGTLGYAYAEQQTKETSMSTTWPQGDVEYRFEISEMTISPDGVPVQSLVINGGYPGPMIEANQGDWVRVDIRSPTTTDEIDLVWYGMDHSGDALLTGGTLSTTYVGAIKPNSTYTLLFRADAVGTSSWYARYTGRRAHEFMGPVLIHGPTNGTKNADYDIDLGPVMLSDWYHEHDLQVEDDNVFRRLPNISNILINGKMSYPCERTTLPCTPNAGLSKFKFQSGKKHLLRLVNTATEADQKFSIDNHTLTVIAKDSMPIDPYSTNVVTLSESQSVDVIVDATGAPNDAVWMRSVLATCAVGDGISNQAFAAVYYEDAHPNTAPKTSPHPQPNYCGNGPFQITESLLPAVLPSSSSSTTSPDMSSTTGLVYITAPLFPTAVQSFSTFATSSDMRSTMSASTASMPTCSTNNTRADSIAKPQIPLIGT